MFVTFDTFVLTKGFFVYLYVYVCACVYTCTRVSMSVYDCARDVCGAVRVSMCLHVNVYHQGETLKYLYLLFSPPTLYPLDE